MAQRDRVGMKPVHHRSPGSLLIADDTGGTISRIAYKGPSERAAAPDTKSQPAGR